VHPNEVETALAAVRGVRMACVFGVPDARWGQLVAAALAVDATFDPDDAVAAWAALAPHQRPRELAVLAALPQLPGGKIDYARAAQLPRSPIRSPPSRR
jgi:O-succinylbenzoic acid--CoA ligase